MTSQGRGVDTKVCDLRPAPQEVPVHATPGSVSQVIWVQLGDMLSPCSWTVTVVIRAQSTDAQGWQGTSALSSSGAGLLAGTLLAPWSFGDMAAAVPAP